MEEGLESRLEGQDRAWKRALLGAVGIVGITAGLMYYNNIRKVNPITINDSPESIEKPNKEAYPIGVDFDIEEDAEERQLDIEDNTLNIEQDYKSTVIHPGDVSKEIVPTLRIADDDLKRPDYEGFTILGKSDKLTGFHEVFETLEGRYIARIGASSFLIDSDGKLLTEGGHFIWRTNEGLYTGYGSSKHKTGRISTKTLDEIFEEHRSILDALKEPTTRGYELSRWYVACRNASDKFGMPYESLMGVAEKIQQGLFERRSDGIYAKFKN